MKSVKSTCESIGTIILLLLIVHFTGDKGYSQESHLGIQHIKVYSEDGRFAGWPANNGIYHWGNEILVGFVEAEHHTTEGFHTYNRETARNKYARSVDGGLTWKIEDAYELGQTGWAFDNNLSEDEAELPTELEEGVEDFTNPDFILSFMRDNYHNGPSIFYYSNNRGKLWNGPYKFPDWDTPGVGTRTDYIVDGRQELGAFLNVGKENGREGRVVYARTEDGALNWDLISYIGPEPEGFDIMPSSIRLSSSDILTVMRSRNINPRRDYLKAYRSVDNGETWDKLDEPVVDTGHGSPPAMIQLEDGRVALAYAYRSEYGSRICLRLSSDNGESWSHEIPVRSGDGANADIGYPRMVQRKDGKVVIIYYWNNAVRNSDSPYRYIAASIIDVEKF